MAVQSGTAALHLALLALDVQAGDEVVVPTYACVSLLHAVHYVGAKPVLVDVAEDFNLDVEATKKAITKEEKGAKK